jgi:hypothetical protein
LLHGSFLLFNSAYLGKARPLVEKRRQAMQLVRRTDGVNLYPAVVFITHPAVHPKPVRVVLDEGAKPDTLYSSRYQPAARFG